MSKIVISNINNIIQLALPKQLVIFSKSTTNPADFLGCEIKKKKKNLLIFTEAGLNPTANSPLSERTGEMC